MDKDKFKLKPVVNTLLLTTLIISSVLSGTLSVDAAASKVKKVASGVKITKSGKLVNVKTHKVVKGIVSYKGKVYRSGKKASGLVGTVYYKNGVKGTGIYRGIQYSKGKKAEGIVNNYYYKAGKKATGIYKETYYKNGKKATGVYKDTYYKNGKRATGVCKETYYKNGKRATGVYKDIYYKNGKIATGVYKDTYYKNGKIATGVYKDTYYKNGKIATGKYNGVYYEKGKAIDIKNPESVNGRNPKNPTEQTEPEKQNPTTEIPNTSVPESDKSNTNNKPSTNDESNISNKPSTNDESNISNKPSTNDESNISNKPSTNDESNMSNKPSTNDESNTNDGSTGGTKTGGNSSSTENKNTSPTDAQNPTVSKNFQLDTTSTNKSEVHITGTVDSNVTGIVVVTTSKCYVDSSKTCTYKKAYTPSDGKIDQIIGLTEGAGEYSISVYPMFNGGNTYYLKDIVYSGKINNTDSVAPLQIGKTTTNSELSLTGRIASNIKSLLVATTNENGTTKQIIEVSGGLVDSKVYLRGGEGNYSIKVYYNTSMDKSVSYPYLMEGTATNSDTRTKYELPSAQVQSDNEELISLANEITNSATTDMEKIKAVHDWVAKNIAYDTDDYFNGLNRSQDAYSTYKRKMAVCQGYADLNAALLRAIGIPTKVIEGIALGYSYSGNTWDEVDKTNSNHAWNEALVDGQWIIIDTTWDAGGINSNQQFQFYYRDTYFNPTAEKFAKDHYRIGEMSY